MTRASGSSKPEAKKDGAAGRSPQSRPAPESRNHASSHTEEEVVNGPFIPAASDPEYYYFANNVTYAPTNWNNVHHGSLAGPAAGGSVPNSSSNQPQVSHGLYRSNVSPTSTPDSPPRAGLGNNGQAIFYPGSIQPYYASTTPGYTADAAGRAVYAQSRSPLGFNSSGVAGFGAFHEGQPPGIVPGHLPGHVSGHAPVASGSVHRVNQSSTVEGSHAGYANAFAAAGVVGNFTVSNSGAEGFFGEDIHDHNGAGAAALSGAPVAPNTAGYPSNLAGAANGSHFNSRSHGASDSLDSTHISQAGNNSGVSNNMSVVQDNCRFENSNPGASYSPGSAENVNVGPNNMTVENSFADNNEAMKVFAEEANHHANREGGRFGANSYVAETENRTLSCFGEYFYPVNNDGTGSPGIWETTEFIQRLNINESVNPMHEDQDPGVTENKKSGEVEANEEREAGVANVANGANERDETHEADADKNQRVDDQGEEANGGWDEDYARHISNSIGHHRIMWEEHKVAPAEIARRRMLWRSMIDICPKLPHGTDIVNLVRFFNFGAAIDRYHPSVRRAMDSSQQTLLRFMDFAVDVTTPRRDVGNHVPHNISDKYLQRILLKEVTNINDANQERSSPTSVCSLQDSSSENEGNNGDEEKDDFSLSGDNDELMDGSNEDEEERQRRHYQDHFADSSNADMDL